MPGEPDTPLHLRRAEAQSILSTMGALNAQLFAAPNISLALESLCGGSITVRCFAGPPPPPSPAQVARLELRAGERLGYRHARLICDDRLLVETENWYRPEALTAEMNRLLNETETPFEKVVIPLQPRRRTLDTKLLWPPLSALSIDRPTELPRDVLEHRALFTTPDNRPLSEVRERYRVDLIEAMEKRRRA